MRHLALILLPGSLLTACMTDTDKALWSETKETFSSGKFASLDAASPSNIASDDEAKDPDKAEPGQATTGR